MFSLMVSGWVFHRTAAPSLRKRERADRLPSSFRRRQIAQSSKFLRNSRMSSVGRPVMGTGTNELDELAISSSMVVSEVSASSDAAADDDEAEAVD